MRVSFTVRGLPAPQGSKRHVGRGVLVESGGQRLKDWRTDVKQAAAEAMRLAEIPYGSRPVLQVDPLAGPVGVSVCFTLPKPKSAPKRRRTWPDRRPDLDKLLRSTLDGLTGEVFADDAQVIIAQVSKGYPGESPGRAWAVSMDTPGAAITVWQIEEEETGG